MKIEYDPKQYKSPQRIYDEINNEYLDLWRTTNDFYVCIDDEYIKIPKGFEYDKVSVPRAVQWYLRRDDAQAIIAGRVHDFLYKTKKIAGYPIRRSRADKIFYELLRHAGMRWSKARLAYAGVVAGGWVAWNKD